MNSRRKNNIAFTALTCSFLLTSASILAQGNQPSVVYTQFDPSVIRSDRQASVLFQAKIAGNPTSVVFEYNTNASPFQQPGTDIDMRDDATGGDRVAGDGVYSVTLQASQITVGLRPDDVFRRFIGFIKLFQGATLIARYNTFAEIITDEIPRMPVDIDAQDAQHTAYLVNIADPAFFTNFDATRVTKRFYQLFQDEYDFLAIVYSPSYIGNRTHQVVKNDVQGIGLRLFDSSGTYGSSGRLKGITRLPITGFVDGANGGYSHELGHQWINYLDIPPLGSGIPHWPLSDLATGIMGWSLPPTNQGGGFPCKLVSEPGGIRLLPSSNCGCFQDLELYLMGLVPPEEVGEHLVFADQEQARQLVGQCNGQLFTGPVLRVSIGDISNAFGRRVPDATTSPKVFRVATIIVSRDGLLNEDAMSFFSFFAQRAEADRPVSIHEGFSKGTGNPFTLTTGRRASLVAKLGDIISSGFTVSTDPSTVNAERGTKVRVVVKINRIGGFTGAVTVVPPEPSMGIKPKPPDPITTTDETATFKLKIGVFATLGTHQLAFTGRDSSGNTSSTTLTVVVE